jgi:hypothetical protein
VKSPRYCDGVERRDVLRIGGAGLFGMGFSLPRILAGQAQAEATGTNVNKGKSLIIVFLRGGLSTIDTWDMKPDAPKEIRGEFQPIPTNVPGIHVCEHMPHLAKQMDKFSLIRSFTHTNNNHGFGDHYMLTGYHPTAAFNRALVPNNERPAHGASVAHLLGPRGTVPPYVCLPTMHRSAGAAYLGPGAEPFVIAADPNAPDFSVPDLAPPLTVDPTRLGSRQHLLRRLGRFERATEVEANRSAETLNVFRQKAFDLMTSPAAKTAFDIELEPEKLREEYGRTTLGQSCLMARRLVEAGVRCVTVEHNGWDTHGDNFKLLKGELLPALDPAMATLFRDLDDRGMLDSTLVVVTGEFGRTPQCAGGGRGHWAPAFTVAIGGGGVQGGRTVGRSDSTAATPDLDPQGPEDLAATIHHLMGIDPATEFHSADGRPFKLVNGGKVMRDML